MRLAGSLFIGAAPYGAPAPVKYYFSEIMYNMISEKFLGIQGCFLQQLYVIQLPKHPLANRGELTIMGGRIMARDSGGGRLDKLVSQGFLLTRSESKAAIRQGRVTVDGAVVRDGASHAAAGAALCLDGRGAGFEGHIYLMLNKPSGYLSATEDSRGETVLDLLPPELRRAGLGVCGRLDKDSEGLVLLMTDGALNHRLTSPRHHAEKLYEVILDAPAGHTMVDAFQNGVVLSDFTAAPAGLEILGDGTRCRVMLREGKYHQIKRMFGAHGLHVVHLERLSMAGLSLDPALKRGEYRPLTGAEIAVLEAAVGRITKKGEIIS